jgi:hypothetical protein
MADQLRQTGSMFVCSPTNVLQDVQTLESIISGYTRLGGKVPPAINAALELAKAGKNVEDSMNVACDGLFNFYVTEQIRCAREAGFKNLDEFQNQRRSDPDGPGVLQVEDCTLRVERRWQITNIDYTINLANKNSAARQFLEKTKKQAFDIVGKWIKKKSMDKIKGKAPSYENPKPR